MLPQNNEHFFRRKKFQKASAKMSFWPNYSETSVRHSCLEAEPWSRLKICILAALWVDLLVDDEYIFFNGPWAMSFSVKIYSKNSGTKTWRYKSASISTPRTSIAFVADTTTRSRSLLRLKLFQEFFPSMDFSEETIWGFSMWLSIRALSRSTQQHPLPSCSATSFYYG